MSRVIEERKARVKKATSAEQSANTEVDDPKTAQSPTTPTAPTTVIPPDESASDASDPSAQYNEVDDTVDNENQTDAQKRAEEIAKRTEKFAGDFTPFRDENDNNHILHEREALSLSSTHCGDVLHMAAFKIRFKLTKDTLELVKTMLRTKARANPHIRVYRRIAMDGDAYLHDWGDPGRHITRVDANGVTVLQSSSVIFSRGKDYGELPAPVIPRDAAEAWEFMQPLLLGVPEADRIPLIVIMTERLRCDTPHPILIFAGQEGAGKSSIAERCAMTLDPSNGSPPNVVHSERAFYSAAQTRHTIMLDNMSKPLGGGLEDSLCKSSGGETIMIPELYTTAESRTLRVYIAWIITGISNNIRQADTLDRSWVIRIEKPSGYHAPGKLRAEYKAALPQVLGALYFFLSKRMKLAPHIEATQLIPNRTVDFLVTGEAVVQVLGKAPGEFIAMVERKRATAAKDWIEYDQFAGALVTCLSGLMKTTPPAARIGNWRTWSTRPGYSVFQNPNGGPVMISATAGAIHRMVADATLGLRLTGKEAECIPNSAPAAADALDRIQNQMERAGWTVKRKPVNNGSNAIWVFRAPL